MTVIDTDTTLGTLVTEHPALARELERLGLDYCCGGRRSLADACREQGLDPEAVAGELEGTAEGSGAPDWAGLAPAELVDHLEATHHRYLHAELPRISALADKVVAAHGGRHAELSLVRDTFDILRADLEPHLVKEERVLFPMIRELAATEAGTPAPSFHCGSLANPIGVMLAEHDTTGDLLAQLRALTGAYLAPDDACNSYRALYAALDELEADTHLHVHKENNLLFPAVLELERRASAGR